MNIVHIQEDTVVEKILFTTAEKKNPNVNVNIHINTLCI